MRTPSTAAIAVALLMTTGIADAAEIHVLATTAMKAALDALAKRVADGEAGDLVILAGGIDDLIRQGRVLPASRTDVARTRIGVAVRKGATKPDISSPEAFRRALLAAKSARL